MLLSVNDIADTIRLPQLLVALQSAKSVCVCLRVCVLSQPCRVKLDSPANL